MRSGRARATLAPPPAAARGPQARRPGRGRCSRRARRPPWTRGRRSVPAADPLPTCATSGMDGFLLPDERAEPLEDGVDVSCVGSEVEDGGEVDSARQFPIGLHELAEVLLLVPGLQRVTLDEPVRLVARQPG